MLQGGTQRPLFLQRKSLKHLTKTSRMYTKFWKGVNAAVSKWNTFQNLIKDYKKNLQVKTEAVMKHLQLLMNLKEVLGHTVQALMAQGIYFQRYIFIKPFIFSLCYPAQVFALLALSVIFCVTEYSNTQAAGVNGNPVLSTSHTESLMKSNEKNHESSERMWEFSSTGKTLNSTFVTLLSLMLSIFVCTERRERRDLQSRSCQKIYSTKEIGADCLKSNWKLKGIGANRLKAK